MYNFFIIISFSKFLIILGEKSDKNTKLKYVKNKVVIDKEKSDGTLRIWNDVFRNIRRNIFEIQNSSGNLKYNYSDTVRKNWKIILSCSHCSRKRSTLVLVLLLQYDILT